ncbi:protein of unknown function [Sterolibacterium denitrificans]|uniref:Uncharacterized protein n=1 Tax=Sterolibacterium denitrificans TaxID=157592 RepID=A0A7Z7HT74_9PROT|nr:protein of unknown function [Sterolibacterium denitrificans]
MKSQTPNRLEYIGFVIPTRVRIQRHGLPDEARIVVIPAKAGIQYVPGSPLSRGRRMYVSSSM